jgi:hypothetical protein
VEKHLLRKTRKQISRRRIYGEEKRAAEREFVLIFLMVDYALRCFSVVGQRSKSTLLFKIDSETSTSLLFAAISRSNSQLSSFVRSESGRLVVKIQYGGRR